MMVKNDGAARITLPSPTELVITREFNAPPALVFKVMHQPEYVRQWYAHRDLQMIVCDIDLRVGGSWRYVLQEPTGGEHAFSGEYQAIDAPGRVVCTERYEPIPGSDHLCTLTLTEHHGKTLFQNHIVYGSQAHRDGHLMSGMEPGMNAALDKLDALAGTLHS